MTTTQSFGFKRNVKLTTNNLVLKGTVKQASARLILKGRVKKPSIFFGLKRKVKQATIHTVFKETTKQDRDSQKTTYQSILLHIEQPNILIIIQKYCKRDSTQATNNSVL